MEHLTDSLSNATNNNVVDSLEVLKDSQSKALETVEQLSDLIEKQPNDSAASEQAPKAEVNLVDLTEDQKQVDDKVNELVNELTSQAEDEQQVSGKVSELISELTSQTDPKPEEKLIDDLIINTSQLSEATKQLFDDLNDTSNTNTLDSSKVLNSSNLENLTAENFLENSIPSNHQALIDDLLDYSVKETAKDHVLDFTQESSLGEDSNKENLSGPDAIQADEEPENLLDELGLKQDDSKDDSRLEADDLVSQEPVQCVHDTVNLADESSKEISLIDVSSDDHLDVQPTEPEEPQNVQSDQPTDPEPASSELLTALISDEPADSTGAAKTDGFFNELNNELSATADELNNMMGSITIQDEQQKEQPVVEQQTLEDHVTKADEIEQPEETKAEVKAENDQLAKSETFLVHKRDEPAKNEIETVLSKEQEAASEQPKEEAKQETKEETKEESSQAAGEQSKEGGEVVVESEPVSPLPTCSKRDSKASEVLTESQEILKNADRLIQAKRNSINQDIRIPGLEISKSNEQSTAQQESSTAAQQPATTEPVTSETQPPTSVAEMTETSPSNGQKPAKHTSSSRKCVIS